MVFCSIFIDFSFTLFAEVWQSLGLAHLIHFKTERGVEFARLAAVRVDCGQE